MSHEPILQVKNITKTFGGLVALKNVNLKLKRNEILGLIGPNGAGKTTLFNVIAGALIPDSGSILFHEKEITRQRPDQRCRLGIARTFQIPKPFQNMDLIENVAVGAYFSGNYKSISLARKKAGEILDLLGLGHARDAEAKTLSVGNRKKLELARALATEPQVLLVDEVMGGLTPTEANEMMDIIRHIRDRGISIMMIEHVMKAVMGVSDRMVVLNYGEILARGTADEVAENPLVIEAYLGGTLHA